MLEPSGISAAYGSSAGLWVKSGEKRIDSPGFFFVTLVLSLLPLPHSSSPMYQSGQIKAVLRRDCCVTTLWPPVVWLNLEGILGTWGQ